MKEPNPIFKKLVKYSNKYHKKSSLIHYIYRIISDICTLTVGAIIIGAISRPDTSAHSEMMLGFKVELFCIVAVAAVMSIAYILVLCCERIEHKIDYTREWLKHHHNDKK